MADSVSILKMDPENTAEEDKKQVVPRATNVVWHELLVDKSTRSQIKE